MLIILFLLRNYGTLINQFQCQKFTLLFFQLKIKKKKKKNIKKKKKKKKKKKIKKK